MTVLTGRCAIQSGGQRTLLFAKYQLRRHRLPCLELRDYASMRAEFAYGSFPLLQIVLEHCFLTPMTLSPAMQSNQYLVSGDPGYGLQRVQEEGEEVGLQAPPPPPFWTLLPVTQGLRAVAIDDASPSSCCHPAHTHVTTLITFSFRDSQAWPTASRGRSGLTLLISPTSFALLFKVKRGAPGWLSQLSV